MGWRRGRGRSGWPGNLAGRQQDEDHDHQPGENLSPHPADGAEGASPLGAVGEGVFPLAQ